MRERINWIDVCRGLGILSVIYAHGLDGQSIRYFFYAFHIPLFFFLSGIVFHHKNHEKFSSILKKAVKNILVPYLFFAGLSYIFWLIFTQFSFFSIEKIPGVLWNILYGNGNQKQFFYNVVLWFLPCLFITQVIFGSLTLISTNKKFLVAVLTFFAGTGYLVSKLYPGLTLPLGLETALTAVVFFGIGYVWNTYSAHTKPLLKQHALTVFVISLAICIFAATQNFTPTHQQIDMRINRLNDGGLFYLGAISGILMSISLSEMLQSNRLLKYLGRHSMVLFIWHLIIFSIISKLLLIITDDQTIRVLRNIYLAPFYSILSTIVILSLAHFFSYLRPRLLSIRR